MLVPLFFFAAFKGALSGIGETKGFGYYDFTAFQFVFILFMASMFAGVFTAFDIASDFESGMGRRLMAAAPKRMYIIVGYLIVSVGRCPDSHRRRLGRRAGSPACPCGAGPSTSPGSYCWPCS